MTNIGRYTVVQKLASGGMAEVYLARIEGLAEFRKRVVIKRILPQLATIPEFVEMFLREARLAALLEHPNVVSVFDLGMEAGTYHLVMEYVEGTSLLALVHAADARREQLPLDLAIWIVMQVLEGLSYAHSRRDESGQPLQLIHRDVSPENVLISNAGSVKLADFGLAKAANHPRVTRTGAFKGKLHYLAPEMVHTSQFDMRVDLFSMGVVLFEALTNTKPFTGPTPNDVLDAVLHGAPPLLATFRSEAPAKLQAVLDRALAKDPAQRYPNARAMHQDLAAVLDDLQSHPGPMDLAAVLERLHPPGAAKGNEATQAPVVAEVGGTSRPPSRRSHVREGPVIPSAPVLPVANKATPPRPTSSSGSSTVRGAPAFGTPAAEVLRPDQEETRPSARRPAPPADQPLLTQLEAPAVGQTQLDIRSPTPSRNDDQTVPRPPRRR